MKILLTLNWKLVLLNEHPKICLTTTTTMKYESVTVDKRLLNSLNDREMEVTLTCIQKILAERTKADKERMKENAIRQIRLALESGADHSIPF